MNPCPTTTPGNVQNWQSGTSGLCCGAVRVRMMKQAASQLLAQKRVAVTGASRTAKGHVSNVIYQRVQDRGYQVFAVNPKRQAIRRRP